nr:hypothetical protein [Bartonella grahamii]
MFWGYVGLMEHWGGFMGLCQSTLRASLSLFACQWAWLSLKPFETAALMSAC